MSEKEMNAIIEKTVSEYRHLLLTKKLQFAIDFGDISVQYDLCLN